MKAIIRLLAALVLSLNAQVCLAQQSLTNGNIRISFPTPNWTETEPPPELRAAYDGTKSPAKLVFHAVSVPSRLRLHITQFDYPDGPRETILAGFLDGVRRRCARQAAGDVVERLDQSAAIPVQSFELDIPGKLFLEIRAILCADRAFLVEIGGPTTSRSEAKQCLNGLFIDRESALPTPVLDRLLQKRAETAKLRMGYEKGGD